MAFAYTGSLNYETLKKYPNREIMLLTETMNGINKRKDAAIQSKTFGMDGPAPADLDVPMIGDF